MSENTQHKDALPMPDLIDTPVDRAKAQIAALRDKNRALGIQLKAAVEDLASLDSCAVCGWYDDGVCRNYRKKEQPCCFKWRGARHERLWEA